MVATPTMVGLAFRPQLSSWLECGRADVDCLEVRAEEFYKGGRGRLRLLSNRFRLVLRTGRLSLGSPCLFSGQELTWFASLVGETQPDWICEHLGFRESGEIDFGSFLPIPLSARSLRVITARVKRVREACGTPVLMGNISSALSIKGEMSEPDFLNRMSESAGCSLALDLTDLLTNSRNFGFDPFRWLDQLDFGNVTQVRVGSLSRCGGSWESTRDRAVNDEIWELLSHSVAKGRPRAIILERAGRFPPVEELEAELCRIRVMCNGCR